MVLNELHAITTQERTHEPDDQTENARGSNEHHPEPKDHVDLLVVQVDGQHALHRVAVVVTKTTHEEVAERDAREDHILRLRPVMVSHLTDKHK